jgi:hypothetical protein
MTKKEKLWQKAKNSPENLTFDEFETLLKKEVIVYGIHRVANLYQFNLVKMEKQNSIKFSSSLNIKREISNDFK